ncbi:MAG: glutamate 5-kinase [Planctomycetaceae bacterium]
MTATMDNLVRREVVETARTLVIKVGTNVLANDDETLNVARVADLAEQIHRVRETGRQVVVVSSGAVGAGIGVLSLKGRPADVPHLQAAAAAGQALLIRTYDECFRRHGYQAAQLLLTANDFKDRRRYLNVRNTLYTLFEYGAVPVVNENDTVSVREITLGDNDQLAAMVTSLLPAPLLVILSAVDGLFDGDPANSQSRVIPLVERWDDRLLDYAAPQTSAGGSGGMSAKLQAVRTATAVGENVIIANGTCPGVIDEVLAAREIGTLFLAQGVSVSARKRWIGHTVPPAGTYVVDAGARKAVEETGGSLLAIGITEVRGHFDKGAVVTLIDPAGVEFARGLTNYGSADAECIAGRRTAELQPLPYAEVVHRDNLVVL